MKFDLEDFNFDLCSAINISQDPNVQVAKTLDIGNGDECSASTDLALSPSMSEAAMTFVKEQSDFVRRLCRLTKFWQQSIAYFEYKSGRSMLFECIAIR